MAGIDKTYISDYQTYDKIRNWAVKQSFTLKNGQKIHLKDYIYYPDITEDEWKESENDYHKEYPNYTYERVLWNTPTYVDIWLIRNCPFKEIQDRLKEQYGGGWSKTAFTDHNDNDMYTQIKEYRSPYDTYQRNGLGKKSKISFLTTFGSPIRDKKCFWWIEVNPYWIGNVRTHFSGSDSYWYNEEKDAWYKDDEALPITCSNCIRKGPMTKKNVVNLIKKWNFPKGTIILFRCEMGHYMYHEFICKVK